MSTIAAVFSLAAKKLKVIPGKGRGIEKKQPFFPVNEKQRLLLKVVSKKWQVKTALPQVAHRAAGSFWEERAKRSFGLYFPPANSSSITP